MTSSAFCLENDRADNYHVMSFFFFGIMAGIFLLRFSGFEASITVSRRRHFDKLDIDLGDLCFYKLHKKGINFLISKNYKILIKLQKPNIQQTFTKLQQTSNKHPTNIQQTSNKHPTNIQQTFNKHPTNCQK
jgi:hypothetical protein